MDPLALLRDYTINGKKVVLDEDTDELIFDSIRYSRNVETVFRSRRGEGPPYTLGAVWFVLQHADKKYADYMAESRKYKIPLVSLIDKKDLVSYLRGEISTCASIQVVPAIPTSLEEHTDDQFESQNDDRANKKNKTEIQDIIDKDESLQKEKEEFSSRLDSRRKKSDSSKPATGVSGLDASTIESLREKRKKIKEKSVSAPDDLERPKGKFVELDAQITREIIDNEKPLYTRTSVLQTRNRRTFNNLIDLATNTLKRDEQKRKAEHAQRRATYDRYQEVEEDKFWKDRLKGNEALEFLIDTRGTFADLGRMPDATQLQARSQAKPDKRPKTEATSSPSGVKADPRDTIPLIIVPSALTSPLTLYNIKEFLQDGVYISTVEKRNSGAKKENLVIVERKKGNSIIKYQIIDNTSKMGTKDWNRLVGVFVLGQAWQFKGWRWDNPSEVLINVPGYFLKYEDEKVPDAIKDWPIKYLTISKVSAKKHLTQAAVREFWDSLDHFIATKKPFVNH